MTGRVLEQVHLLYDFFGETFGPAADLLLNLVHDTAHSFRMIRHFQLEGICALLVLLPDLCYALFEVAKPICSQEMLVHELLLALVNQGHLGLLQVRVFGF